MAQFYTLEEASRVLGMTPEDLKAQAQQRKVRAFLDGGTWRFRVGDVDELARRRGMGSDAELRLSDLDIPVTPSEEPDEIDLSEFQLGVAEPDLGPPTMELQPNDGLVSDSGADQDILLDDLSLPPNPLAASSSVIIGMQTTGASAGESDVRLVPEDVKGASDSDVQIAGPRNRPRSASDSDLRKVQKSARSPGDSDVRLVTPQAHSGKPSDSDVTLIADDTADHGLIRPGSGEIPARSKPQVGSSAEVVAGGKDSDSDFELAPSNVNALEPDSGSDFELGALEASDEFEATPLAGPGDSDVTAADPGISGINLTRPSDSGINLQAASGLNLGHTDSIELAPLDSGIARPTAPPPKKAKPGPSDSGVPSTGKKMSDTMVPQGRKGDKDIFDDTDFEVDALDSGGDSEDRTVQLEATSDFELEEADTGSEVFAIDEEDVDQNAATALGPPPIFEEEEEEPDFAEGAVSGEVSSAWDVESEAPSATARAAVPSAGLVPTGSTAEWGGLWIGMLGVTAVFLLLLTFASMDMARNLYDFRANTPAYGLIQGIAGLVGGG